MTTTTPSLPPLDPTRRGSYIITHSGLFVYPFDPQPEEIAAEDIWWALSRIPRFNGHTKRPYTVAEHSLICAWLAPKPLKLAALLHDAAEAYIGDIMRPVKVDLKTSFAGESLEADEYDLLLAIFHALEVPMPSEAGWTTIMQIDRELGRAELECLFDLPRDPSHQVHYNLIEGGGGGGGQGVDPREARETMATAFEAYRHG